MKDRIAPTHFIEVISLDNFSSSNYGWHSPLEINRLQEELEYTKNRIQGKTIAIWKIKYHPPIDIKQLIK